MLELRRIAVLGAGTWGIALTRMLANMGHDVRVWSATGNNLEALRTRRRHPKLPGVVLPEGIEFTTDLAQACADRDIVVFAVASPYMRRTAASARPFLAEDQLIIDVAKGIEAGTLLGMSRVITDEVSADGKHDGLRVVALSGPTHAEEVARDLPSAIVSASEDAQAAELVQDAFMNDNFRVYTNADVRGVELCGALKNVIALASGASCGLGFGDNTRAALITRGMVEIKRLGHAMGCEDRTFDGLAGVGDLVVTATSEHSRNFRAGRLIGQGLSAEEAVREVGMAVEGINVLPAAMQLAQRYDVEMPVVSAVNDVAVGRMDAAAAVLQLMRRQRKSE